MIGRPFQPLLHWQRIEDCSLLKEAPMTMASNRFYLHRTLIKASACICLAFAVLSPAANSKTVAVLIPGNAASAATTGDVPLHALDGSILSFAQSPVSPSTSAQVVSVTVTPKVQTKLLRLTEYDPYNCTEVSVGGWTIDNQPKYGSVTTNTETGPLSSGACPGVSFTFAALYYTSDKKSPSGTDTLTAEYKSKDYDVTYAFDISILQPPVASNETATTPANASVTIDLTAGATGGAATSAKLIGKPVGGKVSISGTTATFTPDNGCPISAQPGFQFILTNAAGKSDTATATVNITPASSPNIALYLVDPFLLAKFDFKGDLTSLDLSELYRRQNWSQVHAAAITADSTSAAIAIIQTNSCQDVAITADNGTTLLNYSPSFLTSSPSVGQQSLTVSATNLTQAGNLFYAAALVQSPASGLSSFSFESPITITASQAAAGGQNAQQTATMGMAQTPLVLVHGLWGSKKSLLPFLTKLTFQSSWGTHSPALYLSDVIGYASNLAFDASPQAAPTGALGTLAKAVSSILANLDAHQIVGGRVDVVAHSMGGLAVRSYSAQAAYTSPRDRNQGQFHTIVTLDTPETGSALANYLLNQQLPNNGPLVQNASYKHPAGGFPNYPKEVWDASCPNLPASQCEQLTVAQLFEGLGTPIEGGAVASLVPGSPNLLAAPPPNIPNTTWDVVSAVVPVPGKDGKGESAEQFELENLIAGLYANPSQVPTLAQIFGDGGQNDAIVTRTSQNPGGAAQAQLFGGLAHSVVPNAGVIANFIKGLSYGNVTTAAAVVTTTGCWLDPTCTGSAAAVLPGTVEPDNPVASHEKAAAAVNVRSGLMYANRVAAKASDPLTLATPFEVAIDVGAANVKYISVSQETQLGFNHRIPDQELTVTRVVGHTAYVSVTPMLLGRVTFRIKAFFADNKYSGEVVTANVQTPLTAPKAFVGDGEFLRDSATHEIVLRLREGANVAALDPQVIYEGLSEPISISGFAQYRILPDGHPAVIAFATDPHDPSATVLKALRLGEATIEARFGSVVDRFKVSVVPW